MNRHSFGVVTLSALVGFSTAALARQPAADHPHSNSEITIRVQDYAQVPDGVLERAKNIASEIFTEAGIEMSWMHCPTSDAELDKYPACLGPLSPRDLVLRIHPRKPAEVAVAGDVFGFAILSETGGFSRMASVFYDRVEWMTWDVLRPSTEGIFGNNIAADYYTGTTLGLVMAHEMGHLLLGPGSHASQGVMCATFNRKTLEEAYRGTLRFSPDQTKGLRSAVEARIGAAATQWAKNRLPDATAENPAPAGNPFNRRSRR